MNELVLDAINNTRCSLKTNSAVHSKLQTLVTPPTGRRISKNTTESVKVRSKKIAGKAAELFTDVLAELASVHKLGTFTILDVLPYMKEGKDLLTKQAAVEEQRVLAHAAVQMAKSAGRANKSGALGVLAAANEAGRVSAQRLRVLTGSSISSINKAKDKAKNNDFGTFGSLQKRPGVKRVTIPAEEKTAHMIWMKEMCPARSGDNKLIFWMTKDDEDFYFDDYRDVESQKEIYRLALLNYPDLRAKCELGSNVFLRNMRVYIRAKDTGRLDRLSAYKLRSQLKKLSPENINNVVNEVLEEEQFDDPDPSVHTHTHT
jgi:hypothetical protein